MGLGRYLDLSHLAKEIGGPEKSIKIIKAHKGLMLATITLLPFAIDGVFDISKKVSHKIKEFNYNKEP